MKKSLIVLTVITLAIASLLTIGLTGRNSASVIAAQVTLPNTAFVGLGTNNNLSVLRPGSTSFTNLGRVSVPDGDILVGIDFRLQGGGLYAVSSSNVYRIVNSNGLKAVRVSSISPRFNGGAKALMDFNPVANAIRLINTGDQNYAVASANGRDLNTTAVQTKLAYIPGDPNSGTNPSIADGAYTNVITGATSTIFYMVDSGTDKLVTIAPPFTANISSNTGGGRLQTIGSIIGSDGRPLRISPTTCMDIVTDGGRNTIVMITDQTLVTIDVARIPPVLAAGVTQNVRASMVRLAQDPNLIDMSAVITQR